MAKRKSFDEKSKGMHKSRKLIIDTVFGRQDNTQRVFGYEKEVEQKREVGERWTDKDGKEWEQQDGFVSAVTQMDDIRKYLDKLNTCSNTECQTMKPSMADKIETDLKNDGTYAFYEDYKVTLNKLGFARDVKAQYEEALLGIKQQIEQVTEDGRVEKWTWDIDIEKVKQDLRNDINGAYEAIELLIERKRLLEEKLVELNHPELIKK
jgi:hypothetical protein